MKGFKRILYWLKPYTGRLTSIVVLNVFSIGFSIFSLTLLAPFLMLLFDKMPLVLEKPDLILTSDAVIQTFYYYTSYIITHYGKEQALLFISGLVFVAFILKNGFNYWANWLLVPARNGVVKDMRDQLYHSILILPVSFFSSQKKGDIISRCMSDVQEVEVMILRSLQQIFREPLTILLYLICLFFISVKLTFFVLVLLPVGGAIIGLISRKLRKRSLDAKNQMGGLLSMIEESISGLRVIKAFNAIWSAEKVFRKRNKKYTKLMIKIYRKVDLSSPMSEFLGTILVMIIMIYGGSMVLSGENNLTAELFITYIALFSQIINPAKTISVASYNFRKGMSSLDRIDWILNADERITEIENPKRMEHFKTDIVFDQVSFAYDTENVLKDINIKLEKGKTYAICGHSGAGKTTFTDLLLRFYEVSNGEIRIDGTPIKELAIYDLRNLFGIVTQDTVLFNDTVFNNIAFGKPETAEKKVIEVAEISNSMEFINEMPEGLYTNIGDRGVKLSGGQRQRLSIARALLKNPPVLILDEATSALDTESEQLVQDALNHVLSDRTAIIIAHRLSTIKKADLILVFDGGRIVETGNHQELVEKDGIYRKMLEMQSAFEIDA
ncbi:MAG: ABC transporter ATP-binding protein [Bacteroidales bacterium]|nr:ABC transporter ATP-binding protein [Bacteroidales bacterium]